MTPGAVGSGSEKAGGNRRLAEGLFSPYCLLAAYFWHMPQTIELPSRSISFRLDLQVMVVRWHSHAPLEVVQADYAQMLVAAEAHGISDWLLDVRRRDKVTPELSAWVSKDFYPQATQRLAPRRLRMAVLNSPALNQAYVLDPDQKKYVDYVMDPARPFDIGLFDDEGAAMRWLCPEIDV